MPTVTEQIRHALARRDGVSEEAMRELAEAYAVDVSRANQRLAKAVELLHKGLRSEAIQQANLPPNLFDTAAAMDFAEFEEWCDILQFLGIPVPEELKRDLVEELNEAVVEAQPLSELLKQHRRLAIARAPLAWRLQVLRRIAEVDRMTLMWREDLEIWEATRMKQLSVEVSRAVSGGDMEELESLRRELSEVKWSIIPEPELLQRVEGGLQTANEKATSAEWERLSPLLHDAFCQFDEAAARQLAQQWKSACDRSRRTPPAELAEAFHGVEDWLSEIEAEKGQRRERAEAIGKLESALDRNESRVALEAAFHACSRFDEPPPQPLVQRYRLAMEHFELAAARRNQIALAAIVGVIVCAVGGIFLWQRSAVRERSIMGAREELMGFLESKQIGQAEALRSSLETNMPHVIADPRIASLFGRLESLIDEEARRVEVFNDYLRQSDVSSPEEKNVTALARAEELAEHEEEKAAAFRIRRRYLQWDREVEAAHTSELLARVNEIRDESEVLEKKPPEDVTSTELVELLGRLDELIPVFPRASPAAKAQVGSTRTRLISMRDALRSDAERRRTETAAMERLLKSNTLDGLAHNLQAFIDASPSARLSAEFARSLAERSHWSSARVWNDFADELANVLSGDWSEQSVAQLTEQERSLRSKLAANPAEEATGFWKDRIHRSSERDALLDSALTDLRRTQFSGLHTVIQKSSRNRYFVNMEVLQRKPIDADTTANIRIRHIVSATGAETDRGLEGPFELVREPRATMAWLQESLGMNRKQFGKDWDNQWIKLLAFLLQRQGLDFQVKEVLVSELLEVACKGSDQLADELNLERQFFREQALAGEKWFVTTTFQDESSAEMASLFDKLRMLSQSSPKLADEVNRLRQYQYQWIGVLVLDGAGNPQLAVPMLSADSGRIVISKPSTRNSDATDIVIVGQVENGRPLLDGDRADLLAGRPVFFLPN